MDTRDRDICDAQILEYGNAEESKALLSMKLRKLLLLLFTILLINGMTRLLTLNYFEYSHTEHVVTNTNQDSLDFLYYAETETKDIPTIMF